MIVNFGEYGIHIWYISAYFGIVKNLDAPESA